MQAAEMIMMVVRGWLWIGGAVSLVFLTIGIDRVDEDSVGAYVFRPLLIPGILLIWPLVLWRWWQIEAQSYAWANRYHPPRKAHAIAAVVMACVVVVGLIYGLSLRQTWPADIAPIQLSETTS